MNIIYKRIYIRIGSIYTLYLYVYVCKKGFVTLFVTPKQRFDIF